MIKPEDEFCNLKIARRVFGFGDDEGSEMEKETEIHLLRHRLNLQHDMWMSDKLLHERSENIHKERELTMAYEIARLNLIHGVHQKEGLLYKLKLEYALDDLEIIEMRSEVLRLEQIEDQAKAQKYVRNLKSKIRMIEQQIAQRTLEVVQKDPCLQLSVEELEIKHCNETAKLNSDREGLSSMSKNEVLTLLRERDFISDQLKQMEDDYCNRLRSKDQQIQAACESIEKLRRTLKEHKSANDERGFRLTGMKFERGENEKDVKIPEEYALKFSKESESFQELRYAVHKLKETDDSQVNGRHESSENVTSDIEAKNEFPRWNPVQQQLYLHGQNFNTKPRTFSEANVSMLSEHGYLEELRKTSTMLDIARLENENLRMLYAELEAELKHNKPDKRNTACKDLTCRNLANELEVVAKGPPPRPVSIVNNFLEMRSKPGHGIKMNKKGSFKIPAENHDNEVFKINASDNALQNLHPVEINNLGNSNMNKRKAETDMIDFQAVSDSAIIQSNRSTPKRQNRRPTDSSKLEASPQSRHCFSDVRKSKKMCPVNVNFFSAAFSVPKIKAP